MEVLFMFEKIAMFGGVAAIIVAVFAIVILYLTRSNIIDLLDRDVVMYDKNYEIKKNCIHEAFNCLDAVAKGGFEFKTNEQFSKRAKEAYNGLLCTLNSAKLYQEFYRMAIDPDAKDYSIVDIEKFKIDCRKELICKRKHLAEGFKGTATGTLKVGSSNAETTEQPIEPDTYIAPQMQQYPGQQYPAQQYPAQQTPMQQSPVQPRPAPPRNQG
jgi:hypothetical protein